MCLKIARFGYRMAIGDCGFKFTGLKIEWSVGNIFFKFTGLDVDW